ncbi:hypothetical protein ACFZAE_38105 [Streptomyces scabiei]|uniref:hypothetical protein n=1 Tax=Streptomyces scabiei TaxID=1930 RepID=UPI0036E34321
MAGVMPKLGKLSAQEIEAITNLRKAGRGKDAVLELVARAFVRAREVTDIRLTPRNLTERQLSVVRSAVQQLGVSEADLLKMVQNTARWAVREYAEIALRIDRYGDQVARCKPLNQALVSLMGIDAARALRKAGASDKVVAVAEATQAAAEAAGPRAAGALAAIEHVLDSHHIVEQNWFAQFKDGFAKLGWKSVEDMDAIAIPVDVHQRSLGTLLQRLHYEGAPSPSLAAGYTQVTTTLQRRILRPEKFSKLSAEQKASGVFFEITDQSTVKDVVETHLKVYASEPGLAWLHALLEPRLQARITQLSAP